MKITYEISDGYPQTVEVSEDEIRDALDVDEAMEIVDDAIQKHFERNITPNYDERAILRQIEELRSEA